MEQSQKKVATYEWRDILRRALWGLSIPLVSMTYPILNQYRGNTNDLFTFVDSLIPFNKFFILPYVSWYAFILVFSAILCVLDKEKYLKLLITINIGMITCYVIYYFYPTYVPRPIITGRDFLSNLVLNLYANDNPYNAFPSIHVLNSALISFYIYKSDKVNKTIKLICIIMSFSIILSTMFIKQHYFADVVASMVFSCVLYYSFKNISFNFVKDKHSTYIE